jgi:hypothetical protein
MDAKLVELAERQKQAHNAGSERAVWASVSRAVRP